MATARPRLIERIAESAMADMAAEVRAGLSLPGQKELPSKYLYDEIGSALFEVICLLPEYGLSRAGARLLRLYSTEVVEKLPSPVIVAELGSGSGAKTRWVLEALAARQPVKRVRRASPNARYSFGISARSTDDGYTQTARVVKAGKPVALTSSDAMLVR